jgi:hypothetical protein
MRVQDITAVFELQNLVGRLANSFDLKEWDRLGGCLSDNLHTDYQDLRGTPPEVMSREKFVQLRRRALHELQTHHLAGNVEIELAENNAQLRVSMVIYRRDKDGRTLNTHCLYFFGAEQGKNGWRINSIRQKVFIKDGEAGIHSGIAKP